MNDSIRRHFNFYFIFRFLFSFFYKKSFFRKLPRLSFFFSKNAIIVGMRRIKGKKRGDPTKGGKKDELSKADYPGSVIKKKKEKRIELLNVI